MYTVAILTISDKGHAGQREDASGDEAERILLEQGYTITHRVVLPDEQDMVAAELARICDEGLAHLVLTTGGTGFSMRDRTPEATLSVVERQCPGIPEALRAYSMQFTKRAMLSRAAAGIRGQSLIVNLPGSTKAVRECLEYLMDVLGHGLDILTGRDGECAR
jgi:molybdenum cofactor synthesis domain-containing protein